MNKIKVTLEDGKVFEHNPGIRVHALLKDYEPRSPLPVIAAMVNNNVSSLSYPLSINCTVRFLTAADSHGWRVYRNSMTF
ncbi:MAG: AAA family ATPase, partial [Verrucomicrobia bacterium]|nr:AAA family ATPase [Verrucomicrobiota bacterium]